MGTQWTTQEDRYLRKHFAETSTKDIASKLGRTYKSVASRAHLLGLHKSENFFSDGVKSGRINIRYSVATQFKKGQEPWNKGIKGLKIGGEATQFRKGHLPANTKHDGYITVRYDKKKTPYKHIRVAKAKWEYLHRHIWQQENGPIPKGHVVAFKDGNTLNCSIENLICISMKENMVRNSIHRYPEELKETIRLVTKIKKHINNGKESTTRP